MFGIGWMEIAILMAIGVFFMTVFLTVFAAVMKHRAGPSPPVQPVQRPSVQPPRVFSTAALVHFYLVFVLFFALAIAVPIAWVLLGNQALFVVKSITVALLLVALYGVVTLGAVAIASRPPISQLPAPAAATYSNDPAAHADLVARITQRFCPQCRAPLAADAPEGLCPACLMAGGMATSLPLPLGEGRGEGSLNAYAATTPPSGDSRSETPTMAELAEQFPQLEILELLGRGGMGAVYKARQKNLDRIVALKVIPPEAAKDPAFAERFGREARALARMNHPNIVTVYDFGQNGSLYYLLMEYVDGVNLRQTLQAGRLAPPEALAIVPQICDALQFAHDQGVVHRDIKPENVLLDRTGRVKIADFGLAKLLGKGPDNFTLTQTQQVMGTPRYMAPEQIEKPTSVDHRADIYSLGVVIYEMLTGELPIGRFEPPSHKVQLDVRIDQVVLRTLEKEPERRYQRASQLKTELASAAGWPQTVAMAPPIAAPARPVWQTPSPAWKHRVVQRPSLAAGGCIWAAIAAMAAGLLLCSGLLVYLLIPAITSVRSAAQQAQSMNNLKQLGIALHNYEDTYRSFPPAVVTDDNGKPLYSGRVLLLPFLEQKNLYDSFDLTQAWDSPRNLHLSRTPLPLFMDPAGSGGSAGRTDYLFVTGAGTIMEAGKSTKFSEIHDGSSNTILMVEVKDFGINWAEPRDLDISKPMPLPEGHQFGGNLALFADGSVRTLTDRLTPAHIRGLATKAGGEAESLPP